MIFNKDLLKQIYNAKAERRFLVFESKVIEYIKEDAIECDLDILWKQEVLENERYRYKFDLYGFDRISFKRICIEIKTDITRKSMLMVVNQFRKIRSNDIDDSIYLLVGFNSEEERIEYYDITSMVISDKVEIGDDITLALDNYELTIGQILLSNKKRFKNLIINNNDKKKSFPLNLIPPFVGFIFLISVFVLDAINLYSLSYERLILIGIIIVVCLICFIKEIDIKGIVLRTTAKDNYKSKKD